MEELLKLFANQNGSDSPDVMKLLPLFTTLMSNSSAQKKDADTPAPDLSEVLYDLYH